jgi:hypothetical protein
MEEPRWGLDLQYSQWGLGARGWKTERGLPSPCQKEDSSKPPTQKHAEKSSVECVLVEVIQAGRLWGVGIEKGVEDARLGEGHCSLGLSFFICKIRGLH